MEITKAFWVPSQDSRPNREQRWMIIVSAHEDYQYHSTGTGDGVDCWGQFRRNREVGLMWPASGLGLCYHSNAGHHPERLPMSMEAPSLQQHRAEAQDAGGHDQRSPFSSPLLRWSGAAEITIVRRLVRFARAIVAPQSPCRRRMIALVLPCSFICLVRGCGAIEA